MTSNEKTQKSFAYKLGLGIIIFSLSLWLIPIITPFTPIPTKVKAGIIPGSIILAEILFWLGALLVGKEVANKFKSYLNPKKWREKGDTQKMVKEALKKFGRIDILVNNAGIYPFKPLEQMEEKDWDNVLDINLKGTFLCTKAVMSAMKRKLNRRLNS